MGRPPAKPELWPGARDTPFASDPIARGLVATRGPMELEFIGACLGYTRAGTALIVERALRKLAARANGSERRLRELLEGRAELAREPWPW